MIQEKQVQPKEEKDFPERFKKFDEKLRVLLGKYEIGITAQPRYFPKKDGTFGTGAEPVFMSSRNLSKPEEKKELSNPED